ncbi:hypothetical protein FGO68_gene16422 [Halteria grandinella]|uniref:Uncharacterized protein n=1 Tax=Halteria grandinella TaxID=5974 RepID=A0A8J8NY64_HALGN|nr:hypothetical protein FGO68_gene16422 [Halteria grandinella]
MMFNSTYYYQLYSEDQYWEQPCTVYSFNNDIKSRTKTTHKFQNLTARTAYRFRVRQTTDEHTEDNIAHSDYSEKKILATIMEPEHLKNEYVEFYARGSGARNHNTSVFKIDNNVLLDSGVLRGLYLIVLHRANLSKVHGEVFDTMKAETSFPLNVITSDQISNCFNVTTNLTSPLKETTFANGTKFDIPKESSVESQGGAVTDIIKLTTFGNITQVCYIIVYKYNTRNYTKYTVNSDFTVSEEIKKFVTYQNPNEFEAAHRLAKRIKMYDSNYFIIIVSQNAWENNFSKELGNVLMNCGAFVVEEFINHYSTRFGQKTTYRHINDTNPLTFTNFYHPYAFIGIPGLAPGRAQEILRSNVGFHLQKGNYPPAELRVRLRYQPLYAAYTFDTYQYMTENRFKDSYDYINNASDYSLFSAYPYLMVRNLSTYDHWKTAIFLIDDRLGKTPVYFSNATGIYGNQTKADLMYFQDKEAPLKYDPIGRLYRKIGLVWANSKPYYSYVQRFLFNDNEIRDCAPPYNSGDFCYDLSAYHQEYSHIDNEAWRRGNLTAKGLNLTIHMPPEILRCYTGLIPYYCPTIGHDHQNSFGGYVLSTS